MNLKSFKPIISVLTNRYSWAAVGLMSGYFGFNSSSEEWSAVVDLGVAGATVLLLLLKEKGQVYREKSEDTKPFDPNAPIELQSRLHRESDRASTMPNQDYPESRHQPRENSSDGWNG